MHMQSSSRFALNRESKGCTMWDATSRLDGTQHIICSKILNNYGLQCESSLSEVWLYLPTFHLQYWVPEDIALGSSCAGICKGRAKGYQSAACYAQGARHIDFFLLNAYIHQSYMPAPLSYYQDALLGWCSHVGGYHCTLQCARCGVRQDVQQWQPTAIPPTCRKLGPCTVQQVLSEEQRVGDVPPCNTYVYFLLNLCLPAKLESLDSHAPVNVQTVPHRLWLGAWLDQNCNRNSRKVLE